MQQALGIDEAALGLAFLGFPAGGILSFLFGSRVIETLGTKAILAAFIPAIPVGTALLALMPTATTLFLLFLAYGGIYSLPNTAMNIEADRVEAMTGQRIMNSCHGVWSAGQLLATALATVASAAGMTPFTHLILLALPLVPAALAVIVPMTPAPPRAHAGGPSRMQLALPTLAVLALVLYAIGPTLLEGALRTWSVIYMRDSFGSPAWVNTLTLPLFLVAQSAGRLSADGLVTRFGPVPVARALIVIALLGLLAVTFAPNLYVALLGMVLIGIGVCVTYPLTTSAAAQLGDRPASQNVASFTLAVQTLLLGAPALLGFVAAAIDIRATFGIALPMLLTSIWLARRLAPRPIPPTARREPAPPVPEGQP
jgi:MFS family permease